MIEVYFTPTPNGHKVSIMLEETGLPHRLLKMDVLAGDHLTPTFGASTPTDACPRSSTMNRSAAGRRCLSSKAARSCSILPKRAASSCPKIRAVAARHSNG